MNIEPDFQAELKAHYSAIHARLWTPRAAIKPHLLYLPPPESQQTEPIPQQVIVQPTPPPTAEEIAAKWRRSYKRSDGYVPPKVVICVSAAYFNVRMDDLLSKSRKADIAKARLSAMYIMRVVCRSTFMKIGKLLDRDHTCAVHACHRIPDRIKTDEKFSTDIKYIIELLKR